MNNPNVDTAAETPEQEGNENQKILDQLDAIDAASKSIRDQLSSEGEGESAAPEASAPAGGGVAGKKMPSNMMAALMGGGK